MLLTADQFLEIFRIELDDRPQDDGSTDGCLWSDEDVIRYMNSAASQVARRARPLQKQFSLAVTAAEPMVKLPKDRILKVNRAYLQTRQRDLMQLNLNEDALLLKDYGFTIRSSNWEQTTGTPTSFVLDYTPGYIRLAPIPTEDDTLVLHATYLPATLTGAEPLPFTDQEDLDLMLLWMRKMAYDKHDADTFDENKSRSYAAEFAARVAEREPEFRRTTRHPGVVRSSW